MKNYIRRSRNVTLLKRNVKLETGGLYLIQSESVARSSYFASRQDISYAMKMFRRHFSGIIEIVSEFYTNEGFAIFIRVGSEEELKSEWEDRGKKSKEAYRIISEVIRYSISAISRKLNRQSGRKGSVVRENFRTFVLEGLGSLRSIMRKMRRGEIELSGQEVRNRERIVGVGWSEYCLSKKYSSWHVLRRMAKSLLNPIP